MDLDFVQRILGSLFDGVLVTIFLVTASMVCGNALAVPVALARVSRRWWLKAPAFLFILFIRGTPLIVQMFMIYYGLAQFPAVRHSVLWPILREPMWCAVISLSISTAAYSGEVLRGAIQAVPRGEVEAARSVGMPPGLMLRRIVLPIALRQSLPAFANETVLLLKASAIVFTITVRDLMGEANIIRAQTFRTYEPLITAALMYLVLTWIIVRGFAWLEARLSVHRRAVSAGAPGRVAPAAAVPLDAR
ncbi:ABC transporter permease [Inquilinus limosus]|uniref:ABC transporter permease n=1 Tax=Inquilinus limosus TaxID=171674 RepID=UPI0003FD65DF|nr:ABC transporter permease [Inquilinus limosus]